MAARRFVVKRKGLVLRDLCEVRFDTKKFVKLASRDVWYYISKNQRFL